LSERPIILAAIAGAHGVGGEVRLKLFTETVESLKRHERLYAGERPLTLQSVRAAGRGAIARFVEIGDREAAEGVRGQLLLVPRSALPPLEQGEYYHADLIGLACEDQGGGVLGTVVGVENFGAGDLLEIEKPDGKRALVPFKMGIADRIDDTVVVDPAFLA
jgi:16S rRNA processing protein RimM